MQSLMQSVKSWFSGPDALSISVAHIYIDAVEHARAPVWFSEAQVPDTLDGRFEAIIVQLFLLMKALKNTSLHEETRKRFEQRLLEHFVADMDRNLREVGVSDTGMHRRMKHVAEALFGRLKAYHAAWDVSAEAAQQALAKNLYGEAAATLSEQAKSALYENVLLSENYWQAHAPKILETLASV